MNPKIIHQRKRLLNLTNAQLAEKAGITLSNLEKIMSGANPNPSIATLSAIADVIGCTLDDFEQSNPESDVEQRFYVRTDNKLFQEILKFQSDSNHPNVNAAAQTLLWYALAHKVVVKTVGDPMYQEPMALDGIYLFFADLFRNCSEKERDSIVAPLYEKSKGLLDRDSLIGQRAKLADALEPTVEAMLLDQSDATGSGGA